MASYTKFEINPFSVVILSAGNSNRMGSHKAFLKHPDGTFFLENLIEKYLEAGCSEVVVVLNLLVFEYYTAKKYSFLQNVQVVINSKPEAGRFLSIQLGMNALSKTCSCFIQNIDNPFISKELIFKMGSAILPGTCVVPYFNGVGGHPVLVTKEIVNAIKRNNQKDQRLDYFLKNYESIYLEFMDKRILLNINTSNDYQEFINSFS